MKSKISTTVLSCIWFSSIPVTFEIIILSATRAAYAHEAPPSVTCNEISCTVSKAVKWNVTSCQLPVSEIC